MFSYVPVTNSQTPKQLFLKYIHPSMASKRGRHRGAETVICIQNYGGQRNLQTAMFLVQRLSSLYHVECHFNNSDLLRMSFVQ